MSEQIKKGLVSHTGAKYALESITNFTIAPPADKLNSKENQVRL